MPKEEVVLQSIEKQAVIQMLLQQTADDIKTSKKAQDVCTNRLDCPNNGTPWLTLCHHSISIKQYMTTTDKVTFDTVFVALHNPGH